MRTSPPAIPDFPMFEQELAHARATLDAHLEAHPDEPRFALIRAELVEVARVTADGRCPTDEELATITFGAIAARDLDDHPELADGLGRLADYLHQWPRGVHAPSWR